jgi:hypothetical protein
MVRLRHHYHKHFGRHGRFHFATLLTIVVVTYVFVPWIVRLVDALRGYDPIFPYDPKDFTRQDWVIRHGAQVPVAAPGTLLVNIVLILLVVIVWMTVLPRGGARRH